MNLHSNIALIFTLAAALSCTAQELSTVPQSSGVTVSLRGISAVSGQVAWASGEKGTILKTTDGGASWTSSGPPGVADVDFRDIEAIDERTVYVMAAGQGRQSRLYKTMDGGERWGVSSINVEPDGFWDAIAFWDADYGILAGDPTERSDGRFTILTTRDGGINWNVQRGPKARRGEALFAASGTALFARGTREAWIATGGKDGGRVFHTEDGGDTWDEQKTPLAPEVETAGIYSIAFREGPRGDGVGIAVGGDYTSPEAITNNVMRSINGGHDWNSPGDAAKSPLGYRSAVTYVSAVRAWISAGPTGMDVSRDDGLTWEPFSDVGYHAIDFAPDGTGWAVGAEGRIARITIAE